MHQELGNDKLQQLDYEGMLAVYHFRRTDLERLHRLGDEVLRAAEPVMYCAPCFMRESEGVPGRVRLLLKGLTEQVNNKSYSENQVGDETMFAVIVSLGGKVDELQDAYERGECLTEAYMIECIAMELLKKAYELTAERLFDTYGLWMDGYDFLGEKYPLELTEDVFRLLTPERISYNSAYMLTPKKTVVFMTRLQQERKGSYCHVCSQCSNLGCPNRQTEKLNYGYQKIFGKP